MLVSSADRCLRVCHRAVQDAILGTPGADEGRGDGCRPEGGCNMELRGKVALVTGAARGIGGVIGLAREGAGGAVAVGALEARGPTGGPGDGVTPYALASGSELASAAAAVEALGRRSSAIAADVASADQVADMMRAVE